MKQSKLRGLIKLISPPVILILYRQLRKITKGPNGLETKVSELFKYENGFYVELGANDGLYQSNSLLLERKLNWRGILIEPTPHRYLDCINNRSENNNFFCNACVSFEYGREFVEMNYSDLMTTSNDLESDIEDPRSFSKSGITGARDAKSVFSFPAFARTLNSILEESKAPKTIDFLSLDVEGAEIEVLKGINFNMYNFKYMLIECRQIDILREFLTNKGYELVEKVTHHDYLFRLSSKNKKRLI